jgi:outer membrane protein insertion porin family
MKKVVSVAILNLNFNLNKNILKFNRTFFLLSFLFVLSCFLSQIGEASLHNFPIENIEIYGNYSISDEELLDLLDLAKGQSLDRLSLRSGIKRAFLKGIFDNISIESLDPYSTKIKIFVEEKKIIDKIRIKGNINISTGFIKKQFMIKEDERLNLLKLHKAIEDLKKKIAEKGFINVKIEPIIIPQLKNKIELILNIEEGEPEIVKKIIIQDRDEYLISILDIQEEGIFDRTKIERMKEKYIKFYKKNGYIKTSLTYSYSDGTLILTPYKGKKLNIIFEGNHYLSEKSLKKEILFFDLNDFNYDLVEETLARIVMLYHEHGYAFAQVAPIIDTLEDEITVSFFIYEGDQYKIDDVQFEGGDTELTINKDLLKDIVRLKEGVYYNPNLKELDKETIFEFYSSIGHIYASVSEPDITFDNNKVKIVYHIKEGPKIKISDIQIQKNKNISTDTILKTIPLKVGNPYNEVDISEAKRKIIEIYNKQGFLDILINVKQVISEDSATIIFEIEEGAISLYGKNILIGNEKTNYKVIKREFTHMEGQPLDYNIILQERHRLYRLGLFDDIETRVLDKKNDKRDVLYKFKEAKAGSIEFGIGYADYEGLRGFFEISYKNLWGMNRQLSFRSELSTLQEKILLSYFEPWFIERNTSFKSFILYEKRDEKNIDTGEIRYRIKRQTASLGIEKKLSETIKSEFYYDFSFVKTTDILPDIILSKEDTGTMIISGIRTGLIFDTRDNPFDPKKGILAGMSLKFASSLFFSETDFLKLSIYFNKYQSLSKRFTLAASVRGGASFGFGTTRELPIIERFFLGGRTTVRGYEQDTLGPKGADGNPTGGNIFTMANLELRTDIGKGFGIVTFVDAGNVWKKIEDFDLTLKFTTGIGLRYNTPVGPLRIDYGHKLKRQKEESAGEIHFSIGHAF